MLSHTKKNSFTQREIADGLSNTVIRSLRPASLGEIPDARLRKLRAYSQGLIAPVLKHLEAEILRPEEAVMIFATAALFLQLKNVMRTDKAPAAFQTIAYFDGPEAVVLPEAYLSTPEPNDDEILPRIAKPRGRQKKSV